MMSTERGSHGLPATPASDDAKHLSPSPQVAAGRFTIYLAGPMKSGKSRIYQSLPDLFPTARLNPTTARHIDLLKAEREPRKTAGDITDISFTIPAWLHGQYPAAFHLFDTSGELLTHVHVAESGAVGREKAQEAISEAMVGNDVLATLSARRRAANGIVILFPAEDLSAKSQGHTRSLAFVRIFLANLVNACASDLPVAIVVSKADIIPEAFADGQPNHAITAELEQEIQTLTRELGYHGAVRIFLSTSYGIGRARQTGPGDYIMMQSQSMQPIGFDQALSWLAHNAQPFQPLRQTIRQHALTVTIGLGLIAGFLVLWQALSTPPDDGDNGLPATTPPGAAPDSPAQSTSGPGAPAPTDSAVIRTETEPAEADHLLEPADLSRRRIIGAYDRMLDGTVSNHNLIEADRLRHEHRERFERVPAIIDARFIRLLSTRKQAVEALPDALERQQQRLALIQALRRIDHPDATAGLATILERWQEDRMEQIRSGLRDSVTRASTVQQACQLMQNVLNQHKQALQRDHQWDALSDAQRKDLDTAIGFLSFLLQETYTLQVRGLEFSNAWGIIQPKVHLEMRYGAQQVTYDLLRNSNKVRRPAGGVYRIPNRQIQSPISINWHPGAVIHLQFQDGDGNLFAYSAAGHRTISGPLAILAITDADITFAHPAAGAGHSRNRATLRIETNVQPSRMVIEAINHKWRIPR